MSKTYTASVVGAGYGARLSMTALQNSSHFKLAAAADIRPEAIEQARKDFPGIKVYSSHQTMFRDCPTDVVCVSTYPTSHLPITVDALEMLPQLQGILVEKPLGDTAAAGREILRRIKARRMPMAVPHNLLAAPHSLDVLRRVHAGEIGRLELLEVQCDKWDILAGIHWVNYFVALTKAEPVDFVFAAIDATTRTYRDGMQVETEALSYIVTKSGVRAIINTGDYIKLTRPDQSLFFRLVGTHGIIEFPGWSGPVTIVNQQFPQRQAITEFAPQSCTNHQQHLEWMAEQMDNGRPDYTIADSSQAALEITEAIYLSGETRQKIFFPLDSFVPLPIPQWHPGKPYAGQGGGRDGRKLPAKP